MTTLSARHSVRKAGRASQHARRPQKSTRRRVLVGVGIGLIVVLAAGGWVGTRALVVKSELEASLPLVDRLMAQAADDDFAAMSTTVTELEKHTAAAAGTAQDPVWRVLEIVPFAGDNLSAVRITAESIDAIVSEVAAPVVDVASSFDLSARDPETGGFDLKPLDRAAEVAATAKTVVGTAKERLDAVDTSRTIGQVTDAVVSLRDMVDKVDGPLQAAVPLIQTAGAFLGQEGPRNYLLAFQNNAESAALGGSAASFTMVSVDRGNITIAGQADSSDFALDNPVNVAVDQSALDIYSPLLLSRLNTSTSRPDFPTAAEIIRAHWERNNPGSTIDGVVSVDPIALSYMLEATGPITLDLETDVVINSENAVSLLVNQIYFQYPEAEDRFQAGAFFQNAAKSILERLTSGSFNLPIMASALTRGVDQGSIMLWSARPEEQELLDGMRIQGRLPVDNAEATVVGVYFRDTSASKMDYYLETGTKTTSDVCKVPQSPTISTSVTLRSNLTAEQAATLPFYVRSQNLGGGALSTEVFVYGPVGASVAETRVNSAGAIGTTGSATIDDLGRPVAKFTAYLAPGETSTITATFTTPEGTYGPIAVRGTPMIHPTAYAIEPATCG